jgi:hypothetical protein
MRKPLNALTDADIKSTDYIFAVDDARGYEQQVFGHESVPNLTAPELPCPETERLDVDIDSTVSSQLQELLGRVESVRGRLPLAVQGLKQ